MSGTTWESVYDRPNDIMERLAVDGGWLYRQRFATGSTHGGLEWSMALSFVPEPAAPLLTRAESATRRHPQQAER